MADPDLNLLRVFDTLIETRSVTRAAARLGLTQSAVSHALARLRVAFDDPVFVRGPGELQPTTRALDIAPVVRDSLSRLRGAFAIAGFDPARSARRFTIAAGGYFCTLFAADLLAHVRRVAPATSIRIVPIAENLIAALDDGTVDLAIVGTAAKLPARLAQDEILHEDVVWIAACDNPVAHAPFDATALLALPRVTLAIARPLDMAPLGEMPQGLSFLIGLESELAADGGVIVAVVYDSDTTVAIVARTDAVAITPRRTAERAAAAGRIAILGPAGSGFGLAMFRHRRQDADAGLVWLRDTIRALV